MELLAVHCVVHVLHFLGQVQTYGVTVVSLGFVLWGTLATSSNWGIVGVCESERFSILSSQKKKKKDLANYEL